MPETEVTALPGEMVTVAAARLEELVARIFVHHGVDEGDARVVADHLLTAQMSGHHSHGLVRVPDYVDLVARGKVARKTQVDVVMEGPSVLQLDGNHGWGMVIGCRAMEMSMAKARVTGVCVTAVRNASHAGMIGYYAEQAARAGMVGMCFAVGPRSVASMAPWGGTGPVFGTNPLAMGVPAGALPSPVADMATSQVARGKIMVARAEGQAIPPGWAFDALGNPTTDANAAMAGTMYPLGGHKGYALAVMVDLLCGVLSGDADYPVPGGWDKVFLAIDVSFFQPVDQARARVDALARLIKENPHRDGVEEIFLPNEREVRSRARAREEGVPVGAAIYGRLVALAREAGIPA